MYQDIVRWSTKQGLELQGTNTRRVTNSLFNSITACSSRFRTSRITKNSRWLGPCPKVTIGIHKVVTLDENGHFLYRATEIDWNLTGQSRV